MSAAKKIFILAGEASGDRLGHELMAACTEMFGEVSWSGMGGPLMHKQGLVSDEDMDQLSIIGIGAALSAMVRLSRLADRLIENIISQRPEVIFTVDSKGFSVRFAKRLRKRLKAGQMSGSAYQPRIIHMVAPTVWAWGEWRREAFEQNFDAMLCLFPFEPELFDSAKLPSYFIGHSLGWQQYKTPASSEPLSLCLLPGSRRSEITSLLPLFLRAIDSLDNKFKSLRVYLPGFSRFEAMIRAECSQFPELDIHFDFADGASGRMLERSHLILASSGTVTLEAALAGLPGVTAYHMPFLSRIYSRFLFKQHTPILPDILLKSEHYPFLFPPYLTSGRLCDELSACLENYQQRRAELSEASQQLRHMLTQGQPDFGTALRSALKQIFR